MPVVLAETVGAYHREVWDELEAQAPDFTLWQIDPGNDYQYGEYIRDAWDGESDLVLVEQDVVPPAASITLMLACSQPWCSHQVWLGDHYSERTLGLVKFSRHLQRAYRDAADLALPRANSGRPQVHWRSVDSALVRVLDFAKVPLHVHQPPAGHLHKYPESRPADPAPATPGRPA